MNDTRYLKKIQSFSRGELFVVDKMPHNFMLMGLISKCLPEAKIIHVYRHPANTCLSIYKTLFTDTHRYSHDLEELGRYYNGYMRLMSQWRSLPIDFHEVAYEDMVSNIKQSTEELLAYCGLDWEDACLEFYKSKELVMTASSVQVRQPVHSRSVGLWEKYGNGLESLVRILEPSVEQYQSMRKHHSIGRHTECAHQAV